MRERKIVDYWILQEADWECLAELVKKYISSGWQPYGFPYLKDRKSYQPMVKYED